MKVKIVVDVDDVYRLAMNNIDGIDNRKATSGQVVAHLNAAIERDRKMAVAQLPRRKKPAKVIATAS